MDMDIFISFLTATVLPVAIRVLIAIVIYGVGAKLIKVLMNLIKKGVEKANMDASVQTFLMSALRIVLNVVLVFLIVSYLGIATTGIAAIFASVGVTVGLALQGSLSNLAGGVLILVLKPFKVGDYIIATGVEGTVTDIEIFYTKLKTGDNKVITIPNGSLTNNNIINVSHEAERRVDLVFSVSYESDIKQVKNLLTDIAARNELVLQDKGVTVYINEFAASSIDFGFRVWVKSEDYWTVRWQLMEDVKAAFDANKIEIPFNQLDVNMKKQ